MQRSTPRGVQAGSTSGRLKPLRMTTAAGLLACGAMLAFAQQQPPAMPAGSPPPAEKPYLLPEANRPLDANDLMVMQQQQTKKDKFEAANALRRKQISDDAAKLLQLATELKAQVDKTDKDTLSLDVIRKADSIERLAKGVKEKMKLTVGAS